MSNTDDLEIGGGPEPDTSGISWTKEFHVELTHVTDNPNVTTIEFRTALQPNYKLTFSNKVDHYEINNLTVRALFDPKGAMVNRTIWSINENDKILKIFQGALDLTEEFARNAQTDLENKFFRKSFPCKGRSKSERRKLASFDAQQKILEIVNPISTKKSLEQYEYLKNVETPEKFNINYEKYESRFNKLRQDLSE